MLRTNFLISVGVSDLQNELHIYILINLHIHLFPIYTGTWHVKQSFNKFKKQSFNPSLVCEPPEFLNFAAKKV